MDTIDWNRIKSDQVKHLKKSGITFVVGPIHMSKRRINQIVSDVSNDPVVFGILKEEWIPGLEGSVQFKPMALKHLERSTNQVPILNYFFKDLKYIIKELKPKKLLCVNGSWSGQLHYQEFYWKALKRGMVIETISPFVDEAEAKRYERRVTSEAVKQIPQLSSNSKKYRDEDILKMIEYIKRLSWDWIGQIGVVLAKNGKVIASAQNRVMPYEAFQLHEGSVRERLQTPAQEMIETQLTNHAEIELVLECLRSGIDLRGTSLYINMFPCPVCAKMLARTEIKEIVYRQDHNLGNDIGYRILEKSGKKLRRFVV